MSAVFWIGDSGIKWISVIEEEERNVYQGNKSVADFIVTRKLKLLKLWKTNTGKIDKLSDAIKIARLFHQYLKSEKLL